MNINDDTIKTFVSIIETALRNTYATDTKPQSISSTKINKPRKKEIKSFDPNEWNWLIEGTRKKSEKLDKVPKGHKVEYLLEKCKKNKNITEEQYENMYKAFCNVINRSIRKVNKTGNTNDVRAFRRYAEDMSRGFSYLMAPSQYSTDNRPRLNIKNCISVSKLLKKGHTINKNHKGWS
jgi:hypothetical protein